MPTKERAAKEARRDRIRDVAWEVAEHVALANLTTVERAEHGVEFGKRIDYHYWCSCGLPITPIPHYSGRYGVTPIWVCGVCNLDYIIELVQRLEKEVRATEDRGEGRG